MGDASQPAAAAGRSALRAGSKVGPERFVLIKELGRGGMGVVWLAQDTNLGEQVALKFLPREVAADPVALNDLRRETVRSHRLTHPNIIRIHDFHLQPDGVAFISMEYVDGMTLSGWRLQQPGQVFAWEQLAPLVQRLCAAQFAQWPPSRGVGNHDPSLNVDDYPYTSPVGSLAPNQFGLFDLSGNVWEWCEDFYEGQSGRRVLRGASYTSRPISKLTSYRRNSEPSARWGDNGFRCVLVTKASQ